MDKQKVEHLHAAQSHTFHLPTLIQGDEAAVDDKACNLAWAVWLANKGKDPCSSVEREAGRIKDFDYYNHFDVSLSEMDEAA